MAIDFLWVEPEAPMAPVEPVELRTVEGATLTTFTTGNLRVAWPQPTQFVSGAVYDAEGRLVPQSQRIGGLARDHALSVDATWLPPWEGRTVDLPGTWLYAGTWFNHFGHFLTETVTSLWPEVRVDGLVAHPFWFGREVLPWQSDLLALLGHTSPPTVVGAHRLRVERLLVPTRPYLPNGYALSEAVQVWRRMAEAATGGAGGGAEPVYLSRTEHHRSLAAAGRPSARSASNESELDELFRSRGFRVVHPDQLAAADQVRAVAGAGVLVGVSGSALHLSVFAPPGIPVVEVGDVRSRSRPVLTQQILTRACDQRFGYVKYAGVRPAYDIPEMARRLDAMGL